MKQEAKLPYLLECLQKTAPPVLIFAENKASARGGIVCSTSAMGQQRVLRLPGVKLYEVEELPAGSSVASKAG